jgi:hypothetical protein
VPALARSRAWRAPTTTAAPKASVQSAIAAVRIATGLQKLAFFRVTPDPPNLDGSE